MLSCFLVLIAGLPFGSCTHETHLAVHSFKQPKAKGYTVWNEFNVADRWQDKGIRSVPPDTRPFSIYSGNVITFDKQVAEFAVGKPRVTLKYLRRGLLCQAHKRAVLQKLLASMLSPFMVTFTVSVSLGLVLGPLDASAGYISVSQLP